MKHNCHPILPQSRSPKCRRATRRCLLKTHLLGSTPDLGNQTLWDLPFKKVPGNLTHVTLRTTAPALREPEGHQYYRMRSSQRTFWEHSNQTRERQVTSSSLCRHGPEWSTECSTLGINKAKKGSETRKAQRGTQHQRGHQ